MKNQVLIFCFILILFLGIASASFSKGDPALYLPDKHAKGSLLNGWINISLNEENAESLLSSNFGDIRLLDFLRKSDADFECDPEDCKTGYVGSNSATSKSVSLNAGGEKIYVLRLNGEVDEIKELSFSISSTAQKSCIAPLEIDFGADGEIDWEFSESSSDFSCDKSKGCYNPDQGSFNLDKNLSTVPYCEKIRLQESDKFELGAFVKKGTTTGVDLEMQIYDMYEDYLGKKCTLNTASASTIGGLLNCSLDFETQREDYYICIIANKETDWKVKTETNSPCGSTGFPIQDNIDFYIYATNAKFSEIPDTDLEDTDIQGDFYEKFSEIIDEYISDKYFYDCEDSCYFPIKFISETPQTLTIDNLDLTYTIMDDNNDKHSNLLYDSTERTVKIDADMQTMDLEEANFTVKGSYGDKTVRVYLDDNLIDSADIEIVEVAEISGISPSTAAAGIPTTFTLNINSLNGSIVKYTWDFDDGTTQTTSTNQISHTYSEVKEYDLEVTIEDTDGNENTKIFPITVISPEDLIPGTLINKRRGLRKLENKTRDLPIWVQDYFENIIDLENINSSLNNLESEFNKADQDDEFVDIMTSLNALKVPNDLIISESGSSAFVLKKDTFDLGNLREAGAGTYNQNLEDEYAETIIGWAIENIDADFIYKVYSLTYPDKTEHAFTLFSLTINPTEKTFLVFDGSPTFKQDYEEEVDPGFSFIVLQEEKTLEFLYSGKVSLENSLYFSPEFKNLNLAVEERENKFPWFWVILFLVLLLIISFVVYLLLQNWYRKNYEASLFGGNRSDLFNLTNFIKNAFSKGFTEKDVIKKLKQTGWKREQVVYALNKVQGKRTGMFEIPIFSIFSKKKAEATLQENLNNSGLMNTYNKM